jgi:hypothetical protein
VSPAVCPPAAALLSASLARPLVVWCALPQVLCIWRDAWRGQPRESLAFVRANVPRPLLSMRSGILRGPLLRTGAARVPAVARTLLIVSMSSEDGLRASEADLTIVAQV